MTHTKAQLKKLSRAQMMATLMFLLSMIKASNPSAYAKVEKQLFGRKRASKRTGGHKRGKSTPKTRKSRKRASPAQAKNRRRFAAFIKAHGRPPHKGEHL